MQPEILPGFQQTHTCSRARRAQKALIYFFFFAIHVLFDYWLETTENWRARREKERERERPAFYTLSRPTIGDVFICRQVSEQRDGHPPAASVSSPPLFS